MATIGFLNYTDFLEELKSAPPGERPVRVQDYSTSVPSTTVPLEYHTFFVVAAVETPAGDLLVVRFLTGRCMMMDNNDLDRETFKRLYQRNRAAAELLAGGLLAYGHRVGPGIISGSDDCKIETSPGPLWTSQALDRAVSPGEA